MTIEWQNPPGGSTRHGIDPLTDWFAVAAALKTQPGRWALVLKDVGQAHVYRINKGRNMAFRDGVYEAVGRNSNHYDKPAHIDLYVRYIGPKEGT